MTRPAAPAAGPPAVLLGLLLPALLAGVLLGGCGTDGGSADEAGRSAPPSPSASPSTATTTPAAPAAGGSPSGSAPAEPEVVGLVSVSMAGGRVSTRPTPVATPAELAAFLGRLSPTADLTDRLADEVRREVRAVPDATGLHAAVVAVGCVPPSDVTTTYGAGGWRVEPVSAPKPAQVQCLVPVTTVALVRLPAR